MLLTVQDKIITLAGSHGFDAFVVGDMVLIYIEAFDKQGNFFYSIEAVSTIKQAFLALGY
jgi:hypothetical protein